ncbi:MAG TPA: response regulator [Segetibacter sp.]|nr:response regulator [Segetibacter sp.]
MIKSGPIVIIEDDLDDQEILGEIFKRLNYSNKIIFFNDGEEAFAYISEPDVAPFLILSDINMPRLSGLELWERIQANEDLRMKCIPFIFFTTTANKKFVLEAYYKSVQGFFQKPNTLEELENKIKIIIEYWKECIAPNRV